MCVLNTLTAAYEYIRSNRCNGFCHYEYTRREWKAFVLLIEHTGITENATNTLLAVVRTYILRICITTCRHKKVLPTWYARMRTTLGKWERPTNLWPAVNVLRIVHQLYETSQTQCIIKFMFKMQCLHCYRTLNTFGDSTLNSAQLTHFTLHLLWDLSVVSGL